MKFHWERMKSWKFWVAWEVLTIVLLFVVGFAWDKLA